MSAFNGLKLVAAKRPQTASPIVQRRNKLSNQLWEQIELAIAAADGKIYAPIRMRTVKDKLTGERKTIDLACAWAFKDIKKKISGTSSNVEFLDEILDSAFDERGLDLLIEVIKDRIEKDKLSCYAISHRKETIKHIDGETVNLEKENKITRRV